MVPARGVVFLLFLGGIAPMKRFLCFVALVSLAAFSVTGCGGGKSGPRAKLSGTITLDGKPVTIGEIIVYSEDGKDQGLGHVDKDGIYTVEKAPLGKVRISIRKPDLSGSPEVSIGGKKDTAGKDEGAGKEGGVGATDDKQKAASQKAGADKTLGALKGAAGSDEEKKDRNERAKSLAGLPEHYLNAEISGITATVEAGGTTFNIEFKKDSKPGAFKKN